MRYAAYAPGSIVDQIERRELPVNAGVHPDKVITVSAVNRFGFKIETQHYFASSANFQRKLYVDRRYEDVK